MFPKLFLKKPGKSIIVFHLHISDHLLNVQLPRAVELKSLHDPDGGALDNLDHVEVGHDEAPVAGGLGVAGVL